MKMPYRIVLKGRVQGVGGRAYCSHYARHLGLSGSATNLPDGSLQVLLATDDEKMVKEYTVCLRSDPLGVRFFGSITEIQFSSFNGSLCGDYNF